MRSTTIHSCMNVKGYLMNTPDAEMRGVATNEDGKPMSAREFKSWLLDELLKGHKVIPLGKCDNFDYQTGCRGHENEVES